MIMARLPATALVLVVVLVSGLQCGSGAPAATTGAVAPTLSAASAGVRPSPSSAEATPANRALEVVLVAEGRSGSSATLDMLSAVPGAFLLYEPFFAFQPDSLHGAPKLELPGGYDMLFNCSFALYKSLVDRIYWGEACRRSASSKWMSTGLKERCAAGNLTQMDRRAIYRQCTASRVRILKTIRFRGYIEETLPVARPTLRVLHLLRRPADVAESRFRRGWMNYQRTKIAEEVCDSYRQKMTAFSRLSPAQFQRLRGEEIKKEPMDVARRIFAFLDTPFSRADQDRFFKEYVRTSYFHRRRKDSPETEARMLGYYDAWFAMRCPEAIEFYGYGPESDMPRGLGQIEDFVLARNIKKIAHQKGNTKLYNAYMDKSIKNLVG